MPTPQAVHVDFSAVAEQRFRDLPVELLSSIQSVTRSLYTSGSGPETCMSYDAILNEWLRPYGLAQRTVWDRGQITSEITTVEALNVQLG